ncbi:MAG: HD domain-containing protein [Treponema sp.]|nr:HD domain-containing protein [Treponema sp.]MBQ5877956.1 HD domain-containing protein [Treponema sp.]
MKIPVILQKMNNIFEKNGFKAYLVGGAVRDMFMNKEASDWDVATDATPEQVISAFKKVIPTGIAHGTVTVHFMGEEIEVTTFRIEQGYSDGRHPDKVSYASDIEEDLSRRDFTMNAIAVSLKDGSIVDPFNGKADIKNKVIRSVGNPLERFNEDGLRPIRAIRFASQLGFEIETNTLQAISNEKVLQKTSTISIERFRDELVKLLKSPKPSVGLKLLESTNIMKLFLPELLEGRNCIQNDVRGYHVFDVLDHNFYSCDGAPVHKVNVRLAALLHDIGKPASKVVRVTDEGEIYNFFSHEKYSETIARKLLTKLRFSNNEINNVCHLIENHMFHYEESWSDAAIRRFVVRVKPENIEDLIDLRLADMYGKYNMPIQIKESNACDLLIQLQDRIKKIQEENSAFTLKSLAVSGKDLMEIGIPSGKLIGKILDSLLETVLDDPKQNSKDVLLNIAKNLYEQMK